MSQKNVKKTQKNTEETKTSKRKTKKMDKATKLIIAGLVVIAIPFAILGFILLSASLDTGKILSGDRFDDDLNPAITDQNMDAIVESITGSNIEDVEVILKTATLRVYVDMEDSATLEDVQSVSEIAYNAVIAELPVSTFFTRTDAKSMYDLEVHVFDLNENRESDEFDYVITSKSSSNPDKVVDVSSQPKDAEFAQQILDELEAKRNPQPTPDEDELTVGGEDDGVIDEGGE